MEFKDEFDTIISKAKELTDTTVKKGNEVVQVSKLKLECVKLDNEIKASYAVLGRMIYSMVKHDNADSERIAEHVRKIDEMYTKMGKLRTEIEHTRRIITCPVCKAKNKYDNIYCTNCSNRLVVTDEEPEDYSYCNACDD